jgi:hypothetical protein
VGLGSSRYAGAAGADCCSSESIRVKEPALPAEETAVSRFAGAAVGVLPALSNVPNNCVNDPGLVAVGLITAGLETAGLVTGGVKAALPEAVTCRDSIPESGIGATRNISVIPPGDGCAGEEPAIGSAGRGLELATGAGAA